MATGDSINVIGADYEVEDWGIPAEQFGFTATTSVSITNTVNIVEAKNRVGEVVAVVTYDKRAEVTVEGIGQADDAKLGQDITLSEVDSFIEPDSTKIICAEVGVELTNEDWVKTSVKGNVYELIT